MTTGTVRLLTNAFAAQLRDSLMQVILRNPAISLLAARELLDLVKIPGNELHRLSQQFRNGGVVDLESLARSIKITVSIADVATPAISEDDLFRYFVEYGASRQMIRDLVRPIGGSELANIRTELNVSAAKPRSIHQNHAMSILSKWSEICRESKPQAQKLMELHQAFQDYSLASLYALINEA